MANKHVGALWNPYIEATAKKIGERAMAQAWKHTEYAKWYKGIYDWLVAAIVAMALVATTQGAAEIFLRLYANSSIANALGDWVPFLPFITTILGTGAAFALRSLEYNIVAFRHRWSATQFTDVGYAVRVQLSLEREDRSLARDFLEEISDRYNAIAEFSPEMKSWVNKKYRKFLLSRGLNELLETITDVEPIRIAGSNPTSPTRSRSELHVSANHLDINNTRLSNNTREFRSAQSTKNIHRLGQFGLSRQASTRIDNRLDLELERYYGKDSNDV